MDNTIYKDFASWKIENNDTIEEFNKNSSVIYERLEPVYVVLNHIYEMIVEKQDVDEDLETIFQVGFNYLNIQFDIIKIYFETLFQSKCDDFVEYSDMILFLLFIFDLRSDMESNDINSDIEELNELEENIENMIMERRDDHEFMNSKMNEVLAIVYDLLDYEYVSIIDVFVEIAENLGIFIYEDKELLIGRER